MRAQRPPYLAYTCLAASMMLVGTYVGASRLLVAALPVFLLAWLRFGIAALAMIHWVRRSPGALGGGTDLSAVCRRGDGGDAGGGGAAVPRLFG